MEEARVRKTQRRSVLSRHMNQLTRLRTERDAVGIRERLQSMKLTFEELEVAHYTYHDGLKEPADISSSDKWFQEVTTAYLGSLNKAYEWLDEHAPSTVIESSPSVPGAGNAAAEINGLTNELASLLSLPTVDIPVFSGDPREYDSFTTLFDEVVANNLTSDSAKLTRLLQYLSGDARAAVRPCTLSGALGYAEAREALKTRFGSTRLVAQSIIDDLKCGKSAIKPRDLLKLSDELVMAHKTLVKLGAYKEINTQQFIKDVLNRCHPQVKGKWRKFAFDREETIKEYPSFEEFAKFMCKEARRANCPVYGYEAFKTTKSVSCNYVTDKVQGLPGTVQTGKSCCACQGEHGIVQCQKFKSMRPQQRFQVVRNNRLCFCCLSSDHFSRECPKSAVCAHSGCERRHHELLHTDAHKPKPNVEVTSSSTCTLTGQTSSPSGARVATCNYESDSGHVYLPLVPVTVQGRDVYALLDTGSSDTLITRQLADKLGLQGKNVSCLVNTVGNSTAVRTRVVSFDLVPTGGSAVYNIRRAYVVPDIPAEHPSGHVDVSRYPHLADLPLGGASCDVKADIIIGMDNHRLLVPLEVRWDDEHENWPYATRTKLGWALHGPVGDEMVKVGGRLRLNHTKLDLIEEQVENLWSVEHADEDVRGWSLNDHKVNDLWTAEIKLEHGHYTLPIPWIADEPCMPGNRYMAEKRLESTVRRLDRTGMYDIYSENVDKMVSDGHAEKVPSALLRRHDGKVWYLPHHAVIRDDKPGKVRIVHDCAALCQGVSLNNQCHQGPDLNNKLLHVLLRFRQFPYAIMADIKAMYMQVRIPETERDCLRFLWHDAERNLVEYRMTSHLFGGIWCAASSTFALRQTVSDHHTSDLVSDAVFRSMYVDDLLKSVLYRAQAREVINGVPEVLRKGGFELAKFVVNDSQLLNEIPNDDRAQEVKLVTPDARSKALGLHWIVMEDVFVYCVKGPDASSTVTRRAMLSMVSTMYDPLGLVSPIVIKGRLLFQSATKERIGWDDPVSSDLASSWLTWIESLSFLPELKFARCLMPARFADGIAELHHFCDGSTLAYGVCTYLRVLNASGGVQVTLLMARGRLAPLKSLTVPRLELCAAAMAARVDVLARRELDMQLLPSVFWSDSQVVLAYVRSESRRFKVFVANRVALIRTHTKPDQWRYVNTSSNPADVLSRGCVPRSMPASWYSGPDFLSLHRCEWPDFGHSKCAPSTHDPELRAEVVLSHASVLNKDGKHPLVMLIEHYGDYYRMKKALCWLLRIRECLLGNGRQRGAITSSEMGRAEIVLVKHVQSEAYPEVLACLRADRPLPRPSNIRQLCPILLDGVIVVGGRLKHSSSLKFTERHPIILPQGYVLSKKILLEQHGLAHLGTEWTLSLVRRRFWIPRARQSLKYIKHQCVTCKRLYGKGHHQKMADLPQERCIPGPLAFRHVGVDLFGPFLVKVGRSEAKRYGCVFTCFSTRAIHLEVLASLETDTFLNGFVRFCSRRGYPLTVKSDNGTNLVGARAELSRSLKELDRAKVIAEARRRDVEWTFNPPHASHQGGVWERMIRTIRRVLMAVMSPRITVSDEILSTVFCQVENIVNSRPITKCGESVTDDAPLSPNLLLLLEGNYPLAWGVFDSGDAYRKRWRHVQSLVQVFWRRWLREYLPEMQNRRKWGEVVPDLKIGDLVLLMDEPSPRGLWPLARVTEVRLGRDGHVRDARVKARGTILVRPITKLVPLEMN